MSMDFKRVILTIALLVAMVALGWTLANNPLVILRGILGAAVIGVVYSVWELTGTFLKEGN